MDAFFLFGLDLWFHHVPDTEVFVFVAFFIVELVKNIASVAKLLFGFWEFGLEFVEGILKFAVGWIFWSFILGNLFDEVSGHI